LSEGTAEFPRNLPRVPANRRVGIGFEVDLPEADVMAYDEVAGDEAILEWKPFYARPANGMPFDTSVFQIRIGAKVYSVTTTARNQVRFQ